MSSILISVHNIHLFWTTGIYYTSELSKYYRTTLLLENCTDADVSRVLDLTEGRLQDIVRIGSASGLKRHRQYRDVAKKIVSHCKPDIVFAIDDQYPPDLYLLRESKKAASINVCFQVGLMEGNMLDLKMLWNGAAAAHLAGKMRLPHWFALLCVKTSQQMRHLWHYWLAPILVMQHPFPGGSSVYLHRGATGMRDSEYLIIFSELDKRLHLESGTKSKIVVIPPPLTWPSSGHMVRQLLLGHSPLRQLETNRKIVTVFLNSVVNEYAISRETGQVVDRQEIYDSWKAITEVVAQKFRDCRVLLKPHPATPPDDGFLFFLQRATIDLPNVEFVDRTCDVWPLIANSWGIIAGVSTVLFIASLAFPDKVICSLDMQKRLTGDVFKESPNILYFDDLDEFAKCDLASNRDGQSTITDGDRKLLAFVESLLRERASRRDTRT